MSRLRHLLLLTGLLAAVGGGAVHLRAEDEPSPPKPPVVDEVVISVIGTDPVGEASQLARKAVAALLEGDTRTAVDRFLVLAEEYPDVLLPTSVTGDARHFGSSGALRWPAWRVANHALALLPEVERRRVEERWAPYVNAQLQRTRLADEKEAAFEVLSTRYGMTGSGSRALLWLARRDLATAAPLRAAHRLQSWLALNPQASPQMRASVALRLTDALAQLEDDGALDALAVLQQEVRDVPVQVAGSTTTLADRISDWRRAHAETRKERAVALRERAQETPSYLEEEDVMLLWSRSLEDPGYLRHLGYWPTQSVQAGAWGQGDTLVLHEGRVVRRLDLLTGRERWRFPRERPVTIHDPRERYQAFDLPWRSVTPAGDALLVVLGDPHASGRYTFLEQEYDADRLGRECRLRLASLDLATGALQWFTGGVNDTHPILGDQATGIASPPLVVGDDIYCVFARRRGATMFYLACLERTTGEARWVSPLASGESGRLDDASRRRDRFTSAFLQSVPWGARPTRAGDEVCVVPHAGFAAGVDATSGVVRWLRALPRYAMDSVVPASSGQSVQNTPLAWGDTWIVAAMDSPRLCCLARGSGLMRWQRGERGADIPPAWRDLLGAVPRADGSPRLRLSGWQPQMMNPADGGLDVPRHLFEWALNGGDPGGTALDLGAHVARASGGAIQLQPWESATDASVEAPRFLPIPEAPDAGDLLRIGDVWVVIGTERIAALADRAIMRRTGLSDGGPAERGLAALVEREAVRFGDALDAAHALFPGRVRRNTFDTLQRQMVRFLEEAHGSEGEADALRSVAAHLPALPMRLRGLLIRHIALRHFALDEHEQGARVLLDWLASGDDTLIPMLARQEDADRRLLREDVRGEGTRLRRRADLVAAALLREHATHAAVRPLLEAREKALSALLGSPHPSDDDVRVSLRKAVGTHAADQARKKLAERWEAAGRFADAAGVVADRRLDEPWFPVEGTREARMARVARLQLLEARLLAEADEGERARTLVADLERWAPEDTKDAQGRSVAQVSADLQKRFGWYPTRGHSGRDLDVWSGETPVVRDALRSVEFLGLKGPGAEEIGTAYALLVRGITIEVWSLASGERTAVLHGPDEGWFGASLTSVEGWVPGGGIVVSSVVANEPADGSGVNDGDWVTRWNGSEVSDLPSFMQLVAASRPGEEIPVSVWRKGQEVLERFRTGRRPSAEGRLLTYPELYVDQEGRVLVPGRIGLSHVDPRAGTRTPFWAWKEEGVLRRADVLSGVAYVTIQRSMEPHLLVAVDLETGKERWRASVQGRITHVGPVGSALAIHSVSPEQCTLVDRLDGSPRAQIHCFNQHRREFRRNWNNDRPADAAAGRVYAVQGSDHQHHLLILNSTRASLEYEDGWGHPARARFSRFVNPQVAAGAFAAVVRAPGLKLYFADPLGGAPRHSILLTANDLSAQQGNLGAIDDESRVFLRGHRLYVIRLPSGGRKNVSAAIFHVDYAALAGRDVTNASANGDIIHMSTQKIWMAGSPSPARYVLSVRPYYEGVLVSAARLRGEHVAEHYWVVGRDMAEDEQGPADHRNLRLFEGEMREGRRHPPVRSGPWLYVPIDEGARRFPIRRLR